MTFRLFPSTIIFSKTSNALVPWTYRRQRRSFKRRPWTLRRKFQVRFDLLEGIDDFSPNKQANALGK